MSIVVITNNKDLIFQRDVITGIERMAGQYEMPVLIDSLSDHPFRYPEMSLDEITGIIVIANVLDDTELETLFATGKPMTLVSHRVRDLSIPAVIQNNRDGIHKLVDYIVLDCACQSIVFIQGDMGQHDGMARQWYFEQRLMHHSIFIDDSQLIRGDFIPETAVQSMQELLSTAPVFDAVIGADYMMASAILPVLEESGYRPGKDVQVAGFGDGQQAIESKLTTVGTDIIALGQRAARQLIAQINGTPIRGVTWLNTELIERKSTRRAR